MSYDEIRKEAQREWELFTRTNRPRILVGSATCGRAAGSLEVLGAFEEELRAKAVAGEVALTEVGCLGLCYAEVLVEMQGADGRRVLYQGVEPKTVKELVESHLIKGEPVLKHALAVMEGEPLDGIPAFAELPMIRHQERIVLRNCGIIDPGNVSHYIARGGYAGLERAIRMGSDAVIEEIKASGLRGRGGAGFPTGMKWSFARRSPGDVKYVICNADEGDPGAFMDRSVLEGDPHAVLEGLVIAGYAIGASHGYVYCRAEYPLAIERLKHAIEEMKEKKFIGDRIFGSDFDFDIKIKKGAGAFVCGEETALMQSIEGKRGMPKSRPPFPAVSGLFCHADQHQQRRNPCGRFGHHGKGSGVVCGLRDREESRHQDLCSRREDQPYGPHRGAHGDTASHHRGRDRRGSPRGETVQGRSDGRAVGGLHSFQTPGSSRGLRTPGGSGFHHGFRRHDRHRRGILHGGRGPVFPDVHGKRILREVRSVPHGDPASPADPDGHQQGEGNTSTDRNFEAHR